jgi:hypothetical protein
MMPDVARDAIIAMGDPVRPYGGFPVLGSYWTHRMNTLRLLRDMGISKPENQPGAMSPIERLTPFGREVREELVRARSAMVGDKG